MSFRSLPTPDEVAPRGPLVKPTKGEGWIAGRVRRLAKTATEKRNKARVRKEDGGCRWPRCACKQHGTPEHGARLEVDHLLPKSLGGSDDPENLITFCWLRHQGSWSLHTGDLEVEPLTTKGTRGRCAFYERNPETGQMEHVATEQSIGVSETRGR